jgi:hypothetical protein
MCRQWGLVATSDKAGATVEFEFPGGFPSSTLLTEIVPQLRDEDLRDYRIGDADRQ